jgi:4-amino-4-deoxy-L-arabinose transferase-like glycosyltransferase
MVLINTLKRLVIRVNPLILIIAIALIPRLLAALYLGNDVTDLPGTFDQISYNKLALRVLNGYGFSFGEKWWPITAAGAPTAHWSFLYTLFLTGIYFTFGPSPVIARIIQALLVAMVHPLLAYLLGKEVFGRSAGLFAAGITAIYSYFVYYAANLVTEPFYICAVLLVLYLSIRIVKSLTTSAQAEKLSRFYLLAVAFGFALAAAVLLRQLFLLFIPFLYLWIWFSVWRKQGRSAIPYLLVSTVIVGLIIAPFTIYNYQRFHRFVLLNTNAGYAFFWGNHPIYGTHFISILPEEMGSYEGLIPGELRNLDEAALDQALLRRGIQFIIDDPLRYVLLSVSRIPTYFMFWPSPDSGIISNVARVSSFGLFLPLMLFGIFRSLTYFRLEKEKFASPILLLIIFILIYTGIHVLTWTLIRYRLPVDAVLILFAGLAFNELIAIYNKSRSQLSLHLPSSHQS